MDSVLNNGISNVGNQPGGINILFGISKEFQRIGSDELWTRLEDIVRDSPESTMRPTDNIELEPVMR